MPGWQLASRVNLTGFFLFAGLGGWILLSGLSRKSLSAGAVVGVSGASLLAARRLSQRWRWVPPLAIVIAALIAGWSSRVDLFSNAPLSGPFGYANAKASFFVLATVASLMLLASDRRPLRVFGVLTAVVFAVVPFLSGSMAGSILVLMLPLAGLAVYGVRATRAVIKLSGAAFLIALLATLLLAAGDTDKRGDQGVAAASLSERRLMLWHEAFQIMLDHPLNGIGAGRFSSFSDTAQADSDASWAHNEFLQFGAETGVFGFVFLVMLFLWGFALLHLNPQADLVTALSALALCVLGVHSSIDYVMHFPAIPVVVAALVGAGSAPSD